MTTLTTWIATLLLAASLFGAAPGIDRYNQLVDQLYNVGCHLVWPAVWGRSVWACPPNQLWTLTLDEANDTAYLRRVK